MNQANHKDGAPQGALSGAEQVASDWLPDYLVGRKGLRGVIVLDNILNFQDTPRTQTVEGMDRVSRPSHCITTSTVFNRVGLGLAKFKWIGLSNTQMQQ
jgi:hypothetical protein